VYGPDLTDYGNHHQWHRQAPQHDKNVPHSETLPQTRDKSCKAEYDVVNNSAYQNISMAGQPD
jgi:hypothetical protein